MMSAGRSAKPRRRAVASTWATQQSLPAAASQTLRVCGPAEHLHNLSSSLLKCCLESWKTSMGSACCAPVCGSRYSFWQELLSALVLCVAGLEALPVQEKGSWLTDGLLGDLQRRCPSLDRSQSVPTPASPCLPSLQQVSKRLTADLTCYRQHSPSSAQQT